MNRLIIVGNGFDLAHGLKTGYCDFINYYLKEVFENLNQRGYSDELIQVSVLTYIPFYNFPDYKTWANLSPIELLRHFQSIPKLINVQFHSPMLERCIDKAETLNWVDIENEFFEELNTCKNLSTGEFITESVNIVNSQFSFLKEKLIEYLIEVENEAENINRNEELFAAFQKRLDTKSRHGSQKLKKLFLNFNYTDTLRTYLSGTPHPYDGTMPGEDDEIIQIHGELRNKNNPIIFGFGDEHNKHYAEFEDKKNNDVFKHIKSFGYFKTSNYRDLFRFIDMDYFEVYIAGHSCGLSDRTLLRHIFEHQNLTEVKIFYHIKDDGANNYEETTINLARHFTNKQKMRVQILPEQESTRFPQTKINS